MMIIERESSTVLKLSNQDNFREFMIGYLDLLKKELQLFKVIDSNGGSSQYYSCGQPHDKRNPYWKPFKILELYCKRYGYDDLETREIIEERICRKLTCECELLS